MEKKITIVLPKGAETRIELGLVTLTEAIIGDNKEEMCFGLAGAFGYGTNFENDVFMMHRFCWCDKEDCKWCEHEEPNFIYKPSGAKIWWYKWIGRSQEQKGELPKDWLKKCVESLGEKKKK